MTSRAVAAAKEARARSIDVGVVSVPTLDAPSGATLARLRDVPWIITVEDHWAHTGVGGWIAHLCPTHGIAPRLRTIGPEHLPFSGAANDVYSLKNLPAEGILPEVVRMAAETTDRTYPWATDRTRSSVGGVASRHWQGSGFLATVTQSGPTKAHTPSYSCTPPLMRSTLHHDKVGST